MTAGVTFANRAQAKRLAFALRNLGLKPPEVHREGTEVLVTSGDLYPLQLAALVAILEDPHESGDITWAKLKARIAAGS